MAPIMILSVFCLSETVVTFGAPKLFLSPVSPLVNLNTDVEKLQTHLVHCETCEGPHVSFQVTRF